MYERSVLQLRRDTSEIVRSQEKRAWSVAFSTRKSTSLHRLSKSALLTLSRHWAYLVSVIVFFCSLVAPPRSWSAQVSPIVEIKDRAGRSTGSFSYKESYALVVGIDDYTGGWPRLPGVKVDVREIKEILEKRGFYVEVAENLNRTELETVYKNFTWRYGLDPENRLLFYFAGHGYTIRPPQARTDPSAWLGVLVARDAPLPGEEPSADFRRHVLNIDFFASLAREMTAKHALFVFDSCFSGARGFTLNVPTPAELLAPLTRQTNELVRQFISSGTADQQVPDTSEFRRQFVAALKGEADHNKDGYVTGSELGSFLQQQVAHYMEGQQTPTYGKILNSSLDKGDFVFPLSLPSFICTPTLVSSSTQQTTYRNTVGMDFVLIPTAGFTMGMEGTALLRPAHTVTITHPFYLGKHEVTQSQWTIVMGSNPSRFTGDPHLPVENVSWNEIQQFIRKLNDREGANRYRLPSEAEWELAARCTRSGTELKSASDQLDRIAWYDTNANGKTHLVGQLAANDWGLYDMLGNVWEWCADWYGPYSSAAANDPTGPPTGTFRVYRGCGWERGASQTYCHAASRHGARPNFRHPSLGFRLLMEIPPNR